MKQNLNTQQTGNYQTKVYDQRGYATQYTYDTKKGTVSKITDPKGKATDYTYDTLGKMTKVSKIANGKTYSNSYTYENDRIKTITHNGFNYNFIYDTYGNLNQVKVGTAVLSTKVYAVNNGNLIGETYGNNQKLLYAYDRFNRLTTLTGTNGSFTYTYDGKSNVKQIVDSLNNNTSTFTYDLADRLVKEINTNGFTKEYGYDTNNNIKDRTYKLNTKTISTTYNYNNGNQINSVTSGGTTWKYNLDRLSRVNNIQMKNSSGATYTTAYTYTGVTEAPNRTTMLVESIKNGTGEAYSYTYDTIGNIETIKKRCNTNA